MLCACSAAGLEPPFAPNPPSAAANGLAEGELSWAAGGSNLIINGDFEAGTLTGWRKESPTGKDFILNKGAYDPPGSDPVQPVFSGTVSVVATTGAPGAQALVQDLTIPPTATSAVLSWADRIRNYAPLFSHPNQEFRVEIRDPDGSVRAELFSTRPGDPLLQDWTRRSADVSAFIGQTIRVAFVEADDLGLFNVHLDEIRLEVSPVGSMQFDVYLGTNPAPGPAELQGTTDRLVWPVSGLLSETTYYWQVVARDGGQSASSPVWQFKVGPRGPLAGFRWAPLSSPQYRGLPFSVAVRAVDEFRHSVVDFSATVTLAGLVEKSRPAAVLISEVITSGNDSVEFINLSDTAVDISNWKVTIYDSTTWPTPRFTFVIPANNTVGTGRFFFVRKGVQPPTSGLSFATGQDIVWGNTATTGRGAVLLQDAAGAIVDFVCIHDALPGEITEPVPVPLGEWIGPALPLNRDATYSYQRVGSSDRQSAADWVGAPSSSGRVNAGCAARFAAGVGVVGVTPERATDFTEGLWQGALAVQATAETLILVADDRRGHTGLGTPLRVEDQPPIFVDLPEQTVEGAGVLSQMGAVRLVRPWPTDVVVTLRSSDPTAASVPVSVTIPAGQVRMNFDLTVADDAVLDGTQTVTISGSAPGFAKVPRALAVHDNETTTLSLSLPAEAAEGGGTVSGTITLASMPARDLRVSLTADDPTQLGLPQEILVRAGQTSATFTFNVLNDTRIDGDVRVSVEAAVANWTPGRASIVVRDNEHRRLQLRFPVSVSEKAGLLSGGGELAISGTLPEPLAVTLSSDPAGELNLLATITIPAGLTTVKFDVAPTVEADFHGLQVVTVSATAPGFESAQVVVELRDESLRLLDLTVVDIAYDPRAKRLFASVPARALNLANKIVVIDPLTGTVESDISVGSDPGLLALSDDGEVLYVGLNGDLAVQRIKLDTHTPEPPVSLDGYQAVGLVVPAGRPESVLVNRLRPGLGMPIEHGLDVSLYVNGQHQPETVEVFGNVPLGLLRTESPDTAFIGLPNLTELGLRDTGVFVRRSSTEPARVRQWTYGGGYLFSGDGTIVEAATFKPVGSIPTPGLRWPESGLVAADPAHSRVFYLADPVLGGSIGNLQLAEADLLTRTLGHSLPFKYASGFSGLIRWGEDGLAFLIDDKLHLLRSTLVPNGPPVDLRVTKSFSPQPAVVGSDLTFFLTVSNAGPATATSVVLTDFVPAVPKDFFPAAVQLVSARSSQGTCTNLQPYNAPAQTVCELGILASGATALVTIVVRPHIAGLWTNSAVVRSAQVDANPADNTVAVPVPVHIPDSPDSVHQALLQTSDLIYDAGSQRLFASVPADATQFSNSLLRINLASLEVEAAFPIGLNPGKLARSADGQFLYVALDGEAAVRRFDLAKQTAGPQFGLGPEFPSEQFTATDLEVLPNDSEVVVVAIHRNLEPDILTTVAVFDHGTRRESTAVSGFKIEVAGDGQTVYGQVGRFPVMFSSFERLRVGADGLATIDSTAALFAGGEFKLAQGLLYAGSGQIIDPNALKPVGSFEGVGTPGLVVPALEHGRIFFLSPPEASTVWALRAYDAQTRREVGTVGLGGLYSPTSFVRCGPDRFAFRTGQGQLFIVRTSLLPTGPETNLRLELSATPEPVERGQQVELHLVLRNLGVATAEWVLIDLPLPRDFSFRSETSQGLETTHSFGLITASSARLEPGATVEARIAALAAEAGVFIAHARAHSAAVERETADNFVDLPIRVGQVTALNAQTRLELPNSDMVYDPSRRWCYASVPASVAGPVIGDSVAVIDPVTAVVSRFVPLGREPGKLTLSRDGRWLYVAHNADKLVQRVDLATWSADTTWRLSDGGPVTDLRVSPVDPATLAVVRDFTAYLLGDGQPVAIPSPHDARTVVFAEDGGRLFVFGRVGGFWSASAFDVKTTPPTKRLFVDSLANDFDSRVVAAGGRLFSGVGRVLIPDTLAIEETFFVRDVPAEAAPDAEANRVYYLHGTTPRLTVYDLTTKAELFSDYVASGFVGLTAPSGLTRWGADGLAFRTPTDVYFFRNSVLPLVPGQDTDQDGLPDPWERDQQLNPNLSADSGGDTDGDGATNLAEFIAGTDPRNTSSVLRIAALKGGAQGLLLSVVTVGGKRYRLEASAELGAAGWNAVGEVFDGVGGLLEMPVPAAVSAAQFYRVRVVP